MSIAIATLGSNFYNIIFNSILYTGEVHVGYSDPTLFTGIFFTFGLETIATVAIITIIHSHKPFITFQYWKYTCLGFGLLMVCLTTLFLTGFFNQLTLWMFYSGPDPHNWIWALSKGLSFLMFLPFIKERRHSLQ